jgi:predicted GNAT superfamily acetyltransferase
MDTIQIRPLERLDEMRAAVELQKTYWGDDLESVVPAHMLYSLACYGGHVLAAFDGDRMVGVLIGFLGTNIEEKERPAMANLQIVSKRMVVLEAYRGQGIGYRLKIAQRDAAIQQGVRLVTWTFDPLLAANAHLNIRKLGCVSQQYLENYYGTDDEGGLSSHGYSDRLMAEWWVTHRRVEERLNRKRGELGLKHYLEAHTPIANTTIISQGHIRPTGQVLLPSGSLVLVEIPTNFPELLTLEPELAQIWRLHIRESMQRLFGRGYLVTDFIRESSQDRERAYYLLSHSGQQPFDFSRN